MSLTRLIYIIKASIRRFVIYIVALTYQDAGNVSLGHLNLPVALCTTDDVRQNPNAKQIFKLYTVPIHLFDYGFYTARAIQ